ncbi:MAG: cytidine/deoxycytidylate deaminase family protein [Thermoplasmata archaeon]
MARISRDRYYLNIAADVSKRSTCTRHKIGAIVVNGDEIKSTGYNGNPRGLPHCDEIGCIRDIENISSGERMEVCTGVHAEMNALLQAGKGAKGGTLYSTIIPCNTCAKMIINAGIKRVVYLNDYPEKMGRELLGQAGITINKVELPEES